MSIGKKDLLKDQGMVRTFWLVKRIEKKRVAMLAKTHGISESEVIRRLINLGNLKDLAK